MKWSMNGNFNPNKSIENIAKINECAIVAHRELHNPHQIRDDECGEIDKGFPFTQQNMLIVMINAASLYHKVR